MIKQLITFAQNREDLYLYALIGHIHKGFYVDVGANHADLHSVTKLFYDRGWSGINIEPNPILYKELTLKRKRDTNLNIGASNARGTLSFRTYPHHDGLSTFSDPIKKLHKVSNIPFEDSKVKVRKISSVFNELQVTNIDFMKIDVEGYEVEVIEGNDWTKYRPKVLVVEATVRKQLKPIMKQIKYKLEFFDGLNNYYVDKNIKDGISIYNYAPRVLTSSLYTAKEYEDIKTKTELEQQLKSLSEELSKVVVQLENIQGFRNSIGNSIRATKKFARKKISRK